MGHPILQTDYLLVADEELLFIHIRWNRHVEEADHHFFVGLASPRHVALGSGLCGFSSELSYHATACKRVPAFKKRGCANR